MSTPEPGIATDAAATDVASDNAAATSHDAMTLSAANEAERIIVVGGGAGGVKSDTDAVTIEVGDVNSRALERFLRRRHEPRDVPLHAAQSHV